MERVLVIGLGEVGKPLYEIAKECGRFEVYGYDVDPSKSVDSLESIPKHIDYLHIAIPFSERFADIVASYAKMFNAKAVVIHSSVAPGTTRKVFEILGTLTAYSPVRGKHPNLKKHLRFWSKWVAAVPKEHTERVAKHLEAMGFRVVRALDPESLELAKLWETVYRAIMIAAWQEIHRIAVSLGADVEVVARFVKEVHEVLRDRPIYFPGYIGGHCLIPNTRILRSVYGSKLLDFVIESNERRARELEDERVRRDVERVKKVAEEVMNLEYYRDP
ncbi:MAG: GDP-mannose dehydrogenase [Crenarchaeota archaeon]|nr:GDP-mannose dehydrogenase [Thermoproteota archaeon]